MNEKKIAARLFLLGLISFLLLVYVTAVGRDVMTLKREVGELKAQMAETSATVATLQKGVDNSDDEVYGLESEVARQGAQLYQLGLAVDWDQLLANFDEQMDVYEARLKGSDAVGYQYGNLGDNVFPILENAIKGHEIPRNKIRPLLDRLARYVNASEKVGTNEEDSDSRKALAALRKELRGF